MRESGLERRKRVCSWSLRKANDLAFHRLTDRQDTKRARVGKPFAGGAAGIEPEGGSLPILRRVVGMAEDDIKADVHTVP